MTETTTAVANLFTENQDAPARYRELIDPNRAPQPGDTDELRHVAAALGRTPDQIDADQRALMRAADLREIQRDENSALEDVRIKREALEKFDTETKRLEDERSEARRKLDHEANEAWQRSSRISEAQRELVRLKSEHREAFGLPSRQPSAPACTTINTLYTEPKEPVYPTGKKPFGPAPGENDVRDHGIYG